MDHSDYHQASNTLHFASTILISILAIAFVFWFIRTLIARQETSAEDLQGRYIQLIDDWIHNESRALTTTQRQAIAQCVYDEDPSILYVRATTERQTIKSNRDDQTPNSIAVAQSFLDDLEGFIDGQNGNLTTAETTRIKKTVRTCKTRHGF